MFRSHALIRFAASIAVLVALVSCAPSRQIADDRYSRALPDGADALVRVTDPAEFPDLSWMGPIDADLIGALDQSLSYFEKPSSQPGVQVPGHGPDVVAEGCRPAEHAHPVAREAPAGQHLFADQ